MNDVTKKYRTKYRICKTLSALMLLTPIIVYLVMGFVDGTTGQKFTLGMCLTLALIFVLINIVFKHRIRSTLWVMLIGIYICVDNIIPLLILMATSTALDEFVFEPLAKGYKNKYTINREIDKRGL